MTVNVRKQSIGNNDNRTLTPQNTKKSIKDLDSGRGNNFIKKKNVCDNDEENDFSREEWVDVLNK